MSHAIPFQQRSPTAPALAARLQTSWLLVLLQNPSLKKYHLNGTLFFTLYLPSCFLGCLGDQRQESDPQSSSKSTELSWAPVASAPELPLATAGGAQSSTRQLRAAGNGAGSAKVFIETQFSFPPAWRSSQEPTASQVNHPGA